MDSSHLFQGAHAAPQVRPGGSRLHDRHHQAVLPQLQDEGIRHTAVPPEPDPILVKSVTPVSPSAHFFENFIAGIRTSVFIFIIVIVIVARVVAKFIPVDRSQEKEELGLQCVIQKRSILKLICDTMILFVGLFLRLGKMKARREDNVYSSNRPGHRFLKEDRYSDGGHLSQIFPRPPLPLHFSDTSTRS